MGKGVIRQRVTGGSESDIGSKDGLRLARVWGNSGAERHDLFVLPLALFCFTSLALVTLTGGRKGKGNKFCLSGMKIC